MEMTVENYMKLSSAEAAKMENIRALLKSDRALYDLEMTGKNKLSPEFIKKIMPVMVESKNFVGSVHRYQKGLLHPLSNMKIFYDRITEYEVAPKKDDVKKQVVSDVNSETKSKMRI